MLAYIVNKKFGVNIYRPKHVVYFFGQSNHIKMPSFIFC